VVLNPRKIPANPMTANTDPPTNIQMALSVGESVKKREISELSDCEALIPKITSAMPPMTHAKEIAAFMVKPSLHSFTCPGCLQRTFKYAFRFDPQAVRQRRSTAEDRCRHSENNPNLDCETIWGRLQATQAKARQSKWFQAWLGSLTGEGWG
jgi:hypothetical protein